MGAEPKKKSHRVREARLTIDCSAKQKRKIKMLAASRDMSIADFMLELVEEKFTWCPLSLGHLPNSETTDSIEESERGEGVRTFDSMDELFKELDL